MMQDLVSLQQVIASECPATNTVERLFLGVYVMPSADYDPFDPTSQ